MPGDNSKIKINLSGKPKESLTQEFFRWGITIGRIIIVLTELLALGALFYRFTIDRKIIDLHDQINRSELFVKSQAAKENDYRSIQERLDNIKLVEEDNASKITMINKILKAISDGNFQATNLTVNQTIISINGVAFSIFPINNFVEELKKDSDVSSISIDDITSGTDGIQFKLSIEMKQKINPS